MQREIWSLLIRFRRSLGLKPLTTVQVTTEQTLISSPMMVLVMILMSNGLGPFNSKKGNVDVGYCEAMRDSVNSSITQITAHNSVNGQEVYAVLRSVVTSDGNTFAMAPTPSIGVTGEEIATAGWFNTKMQVVSALPAEPDPNVFYFIPE